MTQPSRRKGGLGRGQLLAGLQQCQVAVQHEVGRALFGLGQVLRHLGHDLQRLATEPFGRVPPR